MRKLLILWSCVVVLFCSCGHVSREQGELPLRDKKAEDNLQGVWLDVSSDVPVLKVKGDSIFFANQANVPLHFEVISDTLITYGTETVKYSIDKLDAYLFSFYTAVGDLISLRKSDNDTLVFGNIAVSQFEQQEVLQKDSIIIFQGNRYRGYVYINPTKKKVIRPFLTEEGIYVDNVFYDNIIHICVYQGKQRLFGKDIKKEMFQGVVPSDFLRLSILSDMDFLGVSTVGYQYRAAICMPDSPSCYFVDVLVSKDGNLSYRIKQ